MWLVLWWTLPFLRACSMLADSELGDRQLPDQCSGAPGHYAGTKATRFSRFPGFLSH